MRSFPGWRPLWCWTAPPSMRRWAARWPTTAPWPNLNDDAYQAVAELLALSAGLQVRNIYNDSSALTHAASTLITKPIPAPPPSYTGSPTVWNETVTQLAAEVGWAIAVNGWYANVSGLTTATYLDQNMGLSTVCGTLQLDQDSTSAELSLLSIAFITLRLNSQQTFCFKSNLRDSSVLVIPFLLVLIK